MNKDIEQNKELDFKIKHLLDDAFQAAESEVFFWEENVQSHISRFKKLIEAESKTQLLELLGPMEEEHDSMRGIFVGVEPAIRNKYRAELLKKLSENRKG